MKKIYLLLAILSYVVLLVSCGAGKRTVAKDYQQQYTEQRPNRTRRTVDPCIMLAKEAGTIRSFGTATSYIEKVALNEAERDARNRMAAMLKVAVEGAALDYEQNATQNIKNSAQAISESVMKQYVSETVANTRIIETSIYDLADGSIQVYVCLEMGDNSESFVKKLDNTLEKDDIIGMKYDRDRFIKSISDGLEEYKQKNMPK